MFVQVSGMHKPDSEEEFLVMLNPTQQALACIDQVCQFFNVCAESLQCFSACGASDFCVTRICVSMVMGMCKIILELLFVSDTIQRNREIGKALAHCLGRNECL